jgi:TusA-related sulfurtransferase
MKKSKQMTERRKKGEEYIKSLLELPWGKFEDMTLGEILKVMTEMEKDYSPDIPVFIRTVKKFGAAQLNIETRVKKVNFCVRRDCGGTVSMWGEAA